MSDTRVQVRFSSQGGQQVIQEMQGIGAAGSTSMRGIDQSAANMNTRLAAVDRSVTRSRGNFRQLGLQLNQVGQQGAVTGNYLQALAIQLPDIGLMFGGVGVAIGTVVGFLTPMALGFLEGRDTGNQLEEQMDSLGATFDRLTEAQERLGQTPTELGADFGQNASAMRELFEIERRISEMRAARALTDVSRSVTEGFGFDLSSLGDLDEVRQLNMSFDETEDRIAAIQMQITRATDATERMALQAELVDFLTMRTSLTEALESVDRFAEALDVPADVARQLATLFADLGNATGPQQQFETIQQLLLAVATATNNLDDADEAALSLYDSLFAAGERAAELAGVDIAGRIRAGADAAGDLYANLAAALDLTDEFGARNVRAGIARGEIPPWAENDLPPTTGEEVWQQTLEDRRTAYRRALEAADRESSRSGGGAARESEEVTEAMRRADQVLRQVEVSAVSYDDVLAALQQRLTAGEISQTAFNAAVAALGDEFAALDNEHAQRAIDGIADSLARTAVYGEDLRAGLAQVFQGIAHDILNAGIRQALMSVFSTAGGGGGGGFLGNILGSVFGGGFGGGAAKPLSLEGGGYTGSGPRSGGLDGRGGFMAMLHPDETVVDHTRGQGNAGQASPIFHIDARGAQIGVADQIVGALRAAMPEIERRAVNAVTNARKRGQPV